MATQRAASSSEPYFRTACWSSCSWYPGNASHYRRRTRPRRPRHRLRPGAGHRGALDRGWLRQESRHRRPSCRRGRRRQPRRRHPGADCGDREARREGRRPAMWPPRTRTPPPPKTPPRTRTPAAGSRGPRRSPRSRPTGRRHGSCGSGSDGALFELGCCGPRLQSRRPRVAGTYVVFDTPKICGGSSIGACAY